MSETSSTLAPLGSQLAVPDSPYKGLMPFDEADAAYFFGRDDERRVLCANLFASKLTTVYGASGAGKSSVLRAGAAHHLRGLARSAFAETGRCDCWVVIYSDWRDDPLAGIQRAVHDELVQSGVLPRPSEQPARRLGDTLCAWAREAQITLLLIFDQLEEYFMYHTQSGAPDRLGPELGTLLRDRDGGCHVMLSLREDMLGMLDRMRASLPNVLENPLRIRALNRASATLALTGPLEEYNRQSGRHVTIEPGLVAAVLDQIQSGELETSPAPNPTGPKSTRPTKIEAPYLQLVMQRIWHEEVRRGSQELRKSTLDELGGAQRIVQSHLDTVVAKLSRREREQTARLLAHLVTPIGTKVAHTVQNLAAISQQKTEVIIPLLQQLSSFRGILRAMPSESGRAEETAYEIAHDALGAAINAWRTRHRAQRRRQLILRAFIALLFVPSAVGLLVGSMFGAFDFLANVEFHVWGLGIAIVVLVPAFLAGIWFGFLLKRTT